ncbi:MAG: site-specific DNA-methyltransferase [Methylococcales bacterium]|nr:site-specific DNA-methyltransferase [Methylococcales bacterium]
MNKLDSVIHGDCLDIVATMPENSIDLIYLDPPFFTQKTQQLTTRDGTKTFSYNDLWSCHKEYAEFLFVRLMGLKRVLSDTGSLFVHCDRNASHIIRMILDSIFGMEQFRSEIIWTYKRWSNAKKGLLASHQTLYFYSKTDDFKFNTLYTDYSESTNIDQILQKRIRNKQGKSVYARNETGEIILDNAKNGVPLSDVWDIPYLNPKAKERVGYPTQKPIALLERVLAIASNEGDIVLDPFCGSGTTLVAAKLNNRRYIGIDESADAVELSKQRLESPIKTESELLKKGRQSYSTADKDALKLLKGIELQPVHRNKGVDAILKTQYLGTPVLVRMQKKNESLTEAAYLLSTAAKKRGSIKSFLIKTQEDFFIENEMPNNVEIVESIPYKINNAIKFIQ